MKMIYILLMTLWLSYPSFSKDKVDKVLGLDVRTEQEIQANPAPGSLNIPLGQLSDMAEKKIKDRDQEIYVFCEAGGRAERAKSMLEKMGYKKVKNFKSWREWNSYNKTLNTK